MHNITNVVTELIVRVKAVMDWTVILTII